MPVSAFFSGRSRLRALLITELLPTSALPCTRTICVRSCLYCVASGCATAGDALAGSCSFCSSCLTIGEGDAGVVDRTRSLAGIGDASRDGVCVHLAGHFRPAVIFVAVSIAFLANLGERRGLSAGGDVSFFTLTGVTWADTGSLAVAAVDASSRFMYGVSFGAGVRRFTTTYWGLRLCLLCRRIRITWSSKPHAKARVTKTVYSSSVLPVRPKDEKAVSSTWAGECEGVEAKMSAEGVGSRTCRTNTSEGSRCSTCGGANETEPSGDHNSLLHKKYRSSTP